MSISREHWRARTRGAARGGSTAPASVDSREFTKGGFSTGGLAIYAFPLCNCNTLGSVLTVQIEHMPKNVT